VRLILLALVTSFAACARSSTPVPAVKKVAPVALHLHLNIAAPVVDEPTTAPPEAPLDAMELEIQNQTMFCETSRANDCPSGFTCADDGTCQPSSND
jgi:hypothetical protein